MQIQHWWRGRRVKDLLVTVISSANSGQIFFPGQPGGEASVSPSSTSWSWDWGCGCGCGGGEVGRGRKRECHVTVKSAHADPLILLSSTTPSPILPLVPPRSRRKPETMGEFSWMIDSPGCRTHAKPVDGNHWEMIWVGKVTVNRRKATRFNCWGPDR